MLKFRHVLALLLLTSIPAGAASMSYTGTFTSDTDLASFTFTVANPTAGVALRTWSYAGGTNAAGQVIPGGGFEPYLNLYLADGTQMNPGISGPCTAVPSGNPVADLLPDPVTGACADVYYPTTYSFPGGEWAAGTYTVVLSTFANPGIGNLSDGFFAEQILGYAPGDNFICATYGGNPPAIPIDQPFCDGWNPSVQRTGAWALDIIIPDGTPGPVALPEPATLALFGAGLLAMGRRRARMRKAAA
jgi:hypothetical protein